MPPVVAAPTFAIRKPAVAVFTLDDYVAAGVIGKEQAAILRAAVATRKNILVAGGTSTGKTTLVNALLAEVAKTSDRVILIEDTRELQCAAPNLVSLRTKDGAATLSDLVRSSLRLRPDRIPVGEVRGAEALDLLKAWGTGHPGGVGTIHAGSALGALRRLEQLIQEAVVTVPRALIAETIQIVAVLAGRGEVAASSNSPPSRGWTNMAITPSPISCTSHLEKTMNRLALQRLFGSGVRAGGLLLGAMALRRRPWPPAPTCPGSSRSNRSCNRSRARSPRSSP